MTHLRQPIADYSQADIQFAAECLFHQFQQSESTEKASIVRVNLLRFFIESLNDLLYSSSPAILDKAEKVRLMKLISKLQGQLELIELSLQGEAADSSNMRTAADRMLRKGIGLATASTNAAR